MADRLSELPDDVLRLVLHFVPLKEAASTTALSRRWRSPLWLSSGALNLVTSVEGYSSYRRLDDEARYIYRYRQREEDEARFFYRRDAFLSEALAALDAAQAPITRLTLRIKADRSGDLYDYLNCDRRGDGVVVPRDRNLVDVLRFHRAVRRVEELRLGFEGCRDYVGYTVTPDTLPLETLRVLELTGCNGLLYQREATTAVLPRLSSLRLSDCVQHLSSLQRVIDAAPALAAVRLTCVHIYATYKNRGKSKEAFRCPTVTVLVMDRCSWDTETINGVEINAPRLRRFSYKGRLWSFSFSTPLPREVEQVELHDNKWEGDPDLELTTFWRMVRSFTNTKEMRLKGLNHLEDVAVLTEARRVELLPTFRRLKNLEVQGVHWTKSDTAAVIIVNMLRCCPVLCAIRINLAAEDKAEDASDKKGVRSRIPQKIMHIPALCPRRSLECLQSSLRIVGLQFRFDESNCLGVKLLEFFAENAIVLEEMHINGRDEKLCDHMSRQTDRWNSKRRKSGATSFVVLHHKS